jgi:hypothetical protein
LQGPVTGLCEKGSSSAKADFSLKVGGAGKPMLGAGKTSRPDWSSSTSISRYVLMHCTYFKSAEVERYQLTDLSIPLPWRGTPKAGGGFYDSCRQ